MVWKNSQANDEGEGVFEWKIGSRITLSWKWRNHDIKAHETCLRLKLYKCVCVWVSCAKLDRFYGFCFILWRVHLKQPFLKCRFEQTRGRKQEQCLKHVFMIFVRSFAMPLEFCRDVTFKWALSCVCLSAVDIDSVVGVGLKWIKQTRTSSFFWVVLPYSHGKRSERGCHVPIGNLAGDDGTWIKMDQRVSWKKNPWHTTYGSVWYPWDLKGW